MLPSGLQVQKNSSQMSVYEDVLFLILFLGTYPYMCVFLLEDNEKPMKVIEDEDLVDQHLINELRREYGMTYNDFFMVLTDTDMRAKVRLFILEKELE